MDPAHPSLEAEFFRVRIPASEVMAVCDAYVRDAREPVPALVDKKAMMFRILSLTPEKAEAAVYAAVAAAAVIAVLKSDFPGAALEPATFSEWVAAAPAGQ